MAFCELKYFSPSLGKHTAANILIPENFAPPFPAFYLLHGLSDDYTIWQRRTSLERYASTLPFLIVMPDGGRGFYCDAIEGAAYETAIVHDVISLIDATFQTDREKRCIGGLSMGGYGAIKLALKHPDLFSSATSHSGALNFAHREMSADDAREREFRRILGNDFIGGLDDCYALAKKLKPAERPQLRIDCGSDDFLIEHNREFHAHLKTLNYQHQYAEYSGAHEWSYWDEHIQEALKFHAKCLNLQPIKTEN